MELTLFINQICVLLFVITQIWAAITDMKRFEIPNTASIASVLLFIPFALTAPDTAPDVGTAVLLALGVLSLGFLAFTVGIFGGGDAKLLTGVALWAGLPYFWTAGAYIILAGGALAVFVIVAHMIRKHRNTAYTARLMQVKLPYGVAIACGGLATP
jgi:prepilin peptidase CpaA